MANYRDSVNIQTITPIYTGGADSKKMSRLQETSILGSLRWWYELFLRGMGQEIRQPSDNLLDAEKFDSLKHRSLHDRLRLSGLDEAAILFGATGWQRQFKLIAETNIQDFNENTTLRNKYKAIGAHTQHTGWYIQKPYEGKFAFRLISQDPNNIKIVAGLLQFISDWGTLGAKDQLGMGVVKVTNQIPISTQPLYDHLTNLFDNYSENKMPALTNLFLARINLSDQNPTPNITFNLKYTLRNRFRKKWKSLQPSVDVRHFVMGTVERTNNIAAKVNPSFPYNDTTMRVWGWLPHEADCYQNGWNRDEILTIIKEELEQQYARPNGLIWREFNSSRNTGQKITDIKDFLRDILNQ